MFLVGSVVYIVPGLVFMVFGSGEVQPWNDPAKMRADREAAAAGEAKPTAATMTPTAIDTPSITRL